MELPVRLYHGLQPSRQPLQESTGNVQHSHLSYAQQLELLSSGISPSIPTPPILPTQPLGSTYGPPVYTRLQQRHQLQLEGRKRRSSINPIWLSPEFQAYRKRQADKDDKSDQKWPDVLEDAFLDALLLIPKMGRKKYTMKQTQYGRNMLIGEYLWISYCQSLPPGVEPDPDLWRQRKQVSSHIQVLKNFFQHHRCFHFFFSGRERKEDKNKESVESVSLKNNLVLVALSEGRLPDERPNYEYFSQILAMNGQVVVRPKRCWIFVSNPDVVVRDDGSGYMAATGAKLDTAEYPHLVLNHEREKWAKEEQQIVKGAMLHEFTKEMHQVESSTVRELSKEWETDFPDLYRTLESIVAVDPQLDIMHMHSVLQLKEKRRFPSQSDLNSWIEINIEQPHLLSHRWKVHTQLVRPPELSYSQDNPTPELFYETTAEIAIPYQHRAGCEGLRSGGRDQCDCVSQRCQRDWVTVPFPADVWACTLSNCVEYPAHPFSGIDRRGKRGRVAVKKEDDDGAGARAQLSAQPTQMGLVPKIAMLQEIWSCPPEVPYERNTAYGGGGSEGQGGGDASNGQRWTRRAVILWTFETVHSMDGDTKLSTAKNGRTNWRFLTVLDPNSAYHHQHALVGSQSAGASRARSLSGASSLASSVFTGPSVPRDTVMSPSPAYQQQLYANMSENFAAVWDTAGGGLGSLSNAAAQAAYDAHVMAQSAQRSGAGAGATAGFGLLDSFGPHAGLATPPPSASLTSSFAHSFDGASGTGAADQLANYMAAAHATTAGMDTDPRTLGCLADVTDPFLTGASSATYDVGAAYDDQHHGLPTWDTSNITGINTTGPWSAGYVAAGGASHGGGGSVLDWPQPTTLGSNGGGGVKSNTPDDEREQQHWIAHGHGHEHGQQPPPLQILNAGSRRGSDDVQEQHWAAGVDDGSGLWTPATSTNTHAPTALDTAHEQQWKAAGVPGDEYGAHHDWVRIQPSASELSQDWEEVTAQHQHHLHQQQQQQQQQEMAIALMHHQSPPPPPPQQQQQQQQQQQRLQQSRKHGRSDSLDGACEYAFPAPPMPKLKHRGSAPSQPQSRSQSPPPPPPPLPAPPPAVTAALINSSGLASLQLQQQQQQDQHQHQSSIGNGGNGGSNNNNSSIPAAVGLGEEVKTTATPPPPPPPLPSSTPPPFSFVGGSAGGKGVF
ncbi:hypothetical protein B0T26DRAFT_66251 [Lasiosphaeria miniovina]|uniref:TEA domain-containing protein n=1 Tax=Lasiosphaeria miniovina TaxID=1954250 RepID=A0AA40EDG9_9PEZI|nr:uncharacterized protein B0T26DRAFT_66251 [Lasiosphaeria miniovina]KAK0734347.1 hypothetical protein B0T26DRAFT_66251 [Lasiosphaeria miniovina]